MNTYVAPVSEFTRNPDAAMRPEALLAKIRHAAGDAHTAAIDAHAAAGPVRRQHPVEHVHAGLCRQRGGVPLSHAAINRAIELNGVAVAEPGRLRQRPAAHQPDALSTALRPRAKSCNCMCRNRSSTPSRAAADLTAYRTPTTPVNIRTWSSGSRRANANWRPTPSRGWRWRWRAACSSSWPTDEYEVARLYTGDAFRAQLQDQFEGEYSLRFHMAPPIFARKDPRTGVPRKMTLGPRTMTALKLLARFKRVRGTWLDPFGRTAERKMERALIAEYRQTVDQLLDGLNADKLGQAATIAALAETVRGFGHVKAANVEKYRTELARLMQSYTAPAPRDMPLRKTA